MVTAYTRALAWCSVFFFFLSFFMFPLYFLLQPNFDEAGQDYSPVTSGSFVPVAGAAVRVRLITVCVLRGRLDCCAHLALDRRKNLRKIKVV